MAKKTGLGKGLDALFSDKHINTGRRRKNIKRG